MLTDPETLRGTLVGGGSAQGPGTVSNQYALIIYFSGSVKAGTLIHLETKAGEEILTFAPNNTFGFVTFSSPQLSYGTE